MLASASQNDTGRPVEGRPADYEIKECCMQDVIRSPRRIARGYATVHYKAAMRRDPCVYCGRTSEVLDHIVPASRGGENEWTNRAGICTPCNSRKGASSLLGFLGAMHQRRRVPASREEVVAEIMAMPGGAEDLLALWDHLVVRAWKALGA